MRRDLVPRSYLDAFDRRRIVRPEARAAVLRAMGLDDGEPPSPAEVLIARPGDPLEPGTLVLEDGTQLPGIAGMPRDAPYGYHRLVADGRADRTIICGPGRCHLPAGLRAWGWAIQLATTRSRRSWGIGDLGDLRRLAGYAASHGAGFVAVGPLGAANPSARPEASPYYPSSRRFGNALHIAVDAIPGAAGLAGVRALADEGRRLNGERRVDRGRAWSLKQSALELVWQAAPERDAFDRWRRLQGRGLERWAVFATLSETLGPGWQSWPEEYRRPESRGALRTARDRGERVAFHAWCQWQFERQLAAAGAALPRIADVPIGVDPGGFDAWEWQDQLALEATAGAPPDRFNPGGQAWGLPPFVPHRLRRAGYRPFIETLRAQLRHAGGIRIDHVLGLFRLWWVPAGSSPADGAYVTMPTEELMEIVALESHRAGGMVIGEDLGTVPAGVRGELRRRRILSTRVALFERIPPARYPRQALAAVTTHDLPTIAGLWSGADLEDQARSGVTPDPAGLERLRRRLVRAAGLRGDPPLRLVVTELYRQLASGPAMLVAATLEDALGVEERPNLPGTTEARRDNWSLALPLALEDLPLDADVARLAKALAR